MWNKKDSVKQGPGNTGANYNEWKIIDETFSSSIITWQSLSLDTPMEFQEWDPSSVSPGQILSISLVDPITSSDTDSRQKGPSSSDKLSSILTTWPQHPRVRALTKGKLTEDMNPTSKDTRRDDVP